MCGDLPEKIESEAEYEALLKEAEELIFIDPDKESPEERDRLNKLVDLIVDWEDEHYPISEG